MPALHVHDVEMAYAERGQGPTVIAVHPATSNSVEIGWLAQAITRQGFNVVTPDLRGHGKTPNPAPDLHLPRLVDDMLEFIYQLGRAPVHAAGYSLGGAVMLYAARQRPDLFRSLVILGTTYHAQQEQTLRALGIGPWDEQSPLVRKVFDPETGILPGWDAPLETFKTIACLSLIIMADRDEFHGPEVGVDLYRTLPNAELLVVPRADHLGLVRHPLVMEAVRAFYERLGGKSDE